MANLFRTFQLIETENGWIIRDDLRDSGATSKCWVARDLNDLKNLLTDICAEQVDEKRTASS